ncbi:unnamed protein product [Rhizophagus irregularis]|nr:unnamed protein product [Rhizophagus irregularis]
MYLFLTGDSSALSNKWAYKESPALDIRWKDWFPSGAMYYYADVAKTRKKIKELKSEGEWNEDQFPDMKKELLQTVHIKHESE